MIARLIGLFAALLVFAAAAHAQSDRMAAIDEARAEFAELRETIEADAFDDPAALETRLRSLRDSSRERLAAINREIDALRSQIDALGPAPGEGDPPESADLAAERAALNEEFARLNSQRTRVNANIIEAGDLLARISGARIQSLYDRLTTRGPSPLDPAVWRPALQSASATADKIGAYFENWAARKNQAGEFGPALLVIALALIVAVVLFGPASRWIMTTFSSAVERHEATPARRIVVAGLKMLARAAPGVVGGFVVLETLRAQGVLTDEGELAARALWFGLVVYLLVSGFLRGLFSPANPSWRIAPVDAQNGRVISFLVNAIVVIFGVKILLAAILTTTNAAPELLTVLEAGVAIVVSGLLFLLCRTRLWRMGASLGFSSQKPQETETPDEADDNDKSQFWRLVRRFGRAFAALTVLAALIGYVNLANFAASRLYYFAIILAFAWFVRALLLEFAQYLFRRREADGDLSAEEADRRLGNLRFWNSLIINTLLLIATAPAILILAGIPQSTVRDGFRQAFFGFHIGGVQVPSLAKIFVAVLIFVGVMTLTRVAQRGFRAGPFAHSQVDPGVQNSLITLVGYAGLVVALFASISAIGFDLSNLALIAGALSVGIGFGLQSIVNNFVSGLILLFERPIKVGDWIVTPSGEGTVQKISVRSTEIETFDRSSIIVPNSELISSTVTNWTHRNKLGRVTVPVGVAYGSDVEKVKEILLRCANEHPLIVRYPEPFVTWQDFGDSSLNFDVRGFLSDISKGLSVRTELRFAINKAFAEEGIEIPFPQRDVHVKSWPEAEAPNKESADD